MLKKPYNISATGSKSCTYQVVDRCAQRLSMAQVPPPLGWPGLGQVGSGADRLPASFAQGASEFGTLTRFGEVPFLSGRVRSGLHQPGLPSHCFSQVSGLHLVLSGLSRVQVRWCPGGFRCPLSLFSSPNQVITKGCSSSYEMKESRGQDFVLTPLQVRFPWRCTSSDQILPFLQSSGSKFTLSLISNNDDCAEVEDGWLVFRLCSKSFFWRYSVHNDDVLIWWW